MTALERKLAEDMDEDGGEVGCLMIVTLVALVMATGIAVGYWLWQP